MTLRELENALMNLSIDASLFMNQQYSLLVSSSVSLINSIDSLSIAIASNPLNDECKGMMLQKMQDLDAFACQAIITRFAAVGIDLYGAVGGLPPVMPMMHTPMMSSPLMPHAPMMPQQPMMQQPMMQQMPMQPQMNMMQQPVQQAPQPQHNNAAPPAPAPSNTPPPPRAATAPVATQKETQPAAPVQASETKTEPNESSNGSGTAAMLMGLGGADSGSAAGRDYLVKVINGEI